MPPQNKIFIDLFAGCGGLSLGLTEAGWRGLFAVEVNHDAFNTLRHNLINKTRKVAFDWPTWLPKQPHDITSLICDYETYLSSLRKKVHLVAGGPPCQGFSMAGRRNKNDRRNRLVKDYAKFISIVQPDYLLMENVAGIQAAFSNNARTSLSANSRPKAQADVLLELVRNAGYVAEARILTSSDYGIPQRRPRFILFGIRKDLISGHNSEEDIPRLKEHLISVRKTFLNKKGLKNTGKVSVRQAISDLEEKNGLIDYDDSARFQRIQYKKPNSTYQHLLHGKLNGSAPNSLRRANHHKKTRQRFERIIRYAENKGRLGFSLSQAERDRFGIKKQALTVLDPRKPSHTITTLPDDILHYSEPRILTVRENARLQSFPDWFEFTGKYTTGGIQRRYECPRYTQVGNAVPPFLGEFLGELFYTLDKDIRRKSKTK